MREPSGKHAEEEGCMLSYSSFPNTVSDANFFWRQRRRLTRYYLKMFIHCGSITPMGEHGRLRRTGKINVFELEIATLIFSLKSALVQSLGKDINKVFSVPCGRFMSRPMCIYLVKSTRKDRGHFSKLMTALHKLCKLLSLCQTVHLLNNNHNRDLGIWACRIWNTCQHPL